MIYPDVLKRLLRSNANSKVNLTNKSALDILYAHFLQSGRLAADVASCIDLLVNDSKENLSDIKKYQRLKKEYNYLARIKDENSSGEISNVLEELARRMQLYRRPNTTLIISELDVQLDSNPSEYQKPSSF